MLVGTVEQIEAQMQRDAERFGVSRWTVFVDKPDTPPLAELRRSSSASRRAEPLYPRYPFRGGRAAL